MFILKQLIKLIRLLHADEGAFALALGFGLSLFPGLSGFASILGALSLLIVIFFRVQMGAYFLGYFFFSLLSLPFNEQLHLFGYNVLNYPNLIPIWTRLYQWPIMHWLKFNHTTVMGGQIVGLILFPFCFMLFLFLIKKYQKTIVRTVRESKFYKSFVKLSFVVKYNNVIESLKS